MEERWDTDEEEVQQAGDDGKQVDKEVQQVADKVEQVNNEGKQMDCVDQGECVGHGQNMDKESVSPTIVKPTVTRKRKQIQLEVRIFVTYCTVKNFGGEKTGEFGKS